MSEDMSKIISKYKMYMSFDGNKYEMVQKVELNKIFKEIERLNKALLDIKELVVNNACLSEEYNKCVDDLIYYKCDELLDIVNKALGSDKE